MRFIAVDPGEAWVGIAMLEIRGTRWQAESRVLKVDARQHLLEVAQDALTWAPAIILAEDFRVRPVGHNSFSGGYTLKLLGALEAVTRIRDATWLTMLPGPAADLEMLQLGRFVRRADWAPSSPQWRHALSAWRVLGRHLLTEEREAMEKLRKIKEPKTEFSKTCLAPRTRRSQEDLFSPLTKWKTL
jgi:hypothetical protein